MPFSLPALTAEINNDPKALGYAALKDQPQALADRMNEAGASGETITKDFVPVEDVVAAIVRADYDAAGPAGKTFLQEIVLRGSRVKVGDANVRASLAGIFTAGTTSRANLLALSTRPASRAEILFGMYYNVTDINVAHALGRF
jgi:hypothetical protein